MQALLFLVGAGLAGARGEDDADDEAVQGKGFGKDEDEDHADEQLGLLRVGPAEKVKGQNQIISSRACKQKVVIYIMINLPLCFPFHPYG